MAVVTVGVSIHRIFFHVMDLTTFLGYLGIALVTGFFGFLLGRSREREQRRHELVLIRDERRDSRARSDRDRVANEVIAPLKVKLATEWPVVWDQESASEWITDWFQDYAHGVLAASVHDNDTVMRNALEKLWTLGCESALGWLRARHPSFGGLTENEKREVAETYMIAFNGQLDTVEELNNERSDLQGSGDD